MKKVKEDKKAFITHVLVGYLIISIIFIGLLLHKSSLMHNLEQETYDKIASCMVTYGENNGVLDNAIENIIDEYRNKQDEIEKDTMINGITGFLITVTLIVTSITTIIKNGKRIWKELNMRKNKDGDHENQEVLNKQKGDRKESVDELSYNQINEIIKQICESRERNKEINRKEESIEKILTLLTNRFTQVLDQTICFTNEINQDRHLLTTGMQEIKAAIEQIAQVALQRQKNISSDEEISAAVEQINTAIEEMAQLLIGMEDKVKDLSNNIDEYKS